MLLYLNYKNINQWQSDISIKFLQKLKIPFWYTNTKYLEYLLGVYIPKCPREWSKFAMHWPQIVFQGQFVVIFHMTDAFTYFGISSLPGRWREGGLNVVEGCVVLLGKVWGTGGGLEDLTARTLTDVSSDFWYLINFRTNLSVPFWHKGTLKLLN